MTSLFNLSLERLNNAAGKTCKLISHHHWTRSCQRMSHRPCGARTENIPTSVSAWQNLPAKAVSNQCWSNNPYSDFVNVMKLVPIDRHLRAICPTVENTWKYRVQVQHWCRHANFKTAVEKSEDRTVVFGWHKGPWFERWTTTKKGYTSLHMPTT